MNAPAWRTAPWLPLAGAALATVAWSSAFAAVAHGLRAFTPAELALLRFGIASLVLAPAVMLGWIRLPPRSDWPAVALLALIGMTLYQLAFGQAMTRVSVGAVAVIIALAPGVTSLLAAMRLREPLRAGMALGLGVAFVGVVLVTFGTGHAMRFEPHALLVLVAVFATSVYFVWQKPLLARTTPIGFTTASIFAATLGLLPFGLHLPEKLMLAPLPQVASAAYLAIVPTVFGYVLWNWALSRAPASTVSSMLYAQPLLASVIAWAWLGQTVGLLTLIGGALTLGGVALTVRGSRKPAPAPAPRLSQACLRAACVAITHGVRIQIR
ncbi:MAG TPA: DMT family transporter [Dokdonella sp.]